MRAQEAVAIERNPWSLFPSYCADVPFANLVRWIYDWTAAIEVNMEVISSELRPIHIRPSNRDASDFKLDAIYFDIETADSLDTEETLTAGGVNRHLGREDWYSRSRYNRSYVRASSAKVLFFSRSTSFRCWHTNDIPPLVKERVKVINIEGEDDDEREAGLLWWFKHRLNDYDLDLIG